MSNLDDAVKRIKELECPTGDVQNRIAQIIVSYEAADIHQVTVNREEELDEDGAQAYIARMSNIEDKDIVVLATSGIDDYVAKVVDVYVR